MAGAKSRSLDYATRKLIADTVAEEMRAALLLQREPAAPSLHGPCSPACEDFVLGAALRGDVSAPEFGLKPSDFWVEANRRIWEALTLGATGPEEIVSLLSERGRISGPPEYWTDRITELRDAADPALGIVDACEAAALLLEHARARRTADIMARLADGICAGSETHQSAYEALRAHFAAERRA